MTSQLGLYRQKVRAGLTTEDMVAIAGDRQLTATQIAYFYGRALSRPDIDWQRVNAEILSRYELSGLRRIKKLAWKLAL